LDGGVHVLRTDSDDARDAWLKAKAGFTVLRFDNEAVLRNPGVVMEAVRTHAARTR
jgi:very-short-patch-repair endonuclease